MPISDPINPTVGRRTRFDAVLAVQKADAATFLADSLSFPAELLSALRESDLVVVEYEDGSAATWMRSSVAYGDGSATSPYFVDEEIIVAPDYPANLNADVRAGWDAGDLGTQGPYLRVVGIVSLSPLVFGLLKLNEIPGTLAP